MVYMVVFELNLFTKQLEIWSSLVWWLRSTYLYSLSLTRFEYDYVRYTKVIGTHPQPQDKSLIIAKWVHNLFAKMVISHHYYHLRTERLWMVVVVAGYLIVIEGNFHFSCIASGHEFWQKLFWKFFFLG